MLIPDIYFSVDNKLGFVLFTDVYLAIVKYAIPISAFHIMFIQRKLHQLTIILRNIDIRYNIAM